MITLGREFDEQYYINLFRIGDICVWTNVSDTLNVFDTVKGRLLTCISDNDVFIIAGRFSVFFKAGTENFRICRLEVVVRSGMKGVVVIVVPHDIQHIRFS